MRADVSLCLIVKNEEANLPACLQSAADLVGEIIVVDTGSSDRTRDVAVQLGARVFDFPWIDDFAAARNETLRHATRKWIFWLDADDRLDEPNRRRLQALLESLRDENAGYLMRCFCALEANKAEVAVFDHVRLFRNQPGIHWRYRIHEQILPSLEQLHYAIRRADVNILHVGYQGEAAQAHKFERNLRLLQQEDKEHPNDPFILFNLAQVHRGLGRLTEAWGLYQRSLRLAPRTGPAYVRTVYTRLAEVGRQLGQAHDALRLCREGLARFPNDAELIFQEAWLLYLFGDVQGTEARFLQLLQLPRKADTDLQIGSDPGLTGYQTRHNLAVLYRDQQRLWEAENQWQAALAEQPEFTPARLGLGELYLGQQRWQEVEQVLSRLEADPHTAVEAAVLRSQKHLMLGELAAARQVLEKVIAAAPQALGPRIVYSRVLMQQGQDRRAIEESLRAVLALDPNNAEARGNLSRYVQ